MIRGPHITAWRSQAPWSTDAQIEQDLIISRAVVEMFSDDYVNKHLAFRGGTALHKLILPPPARYSEDIDLVQAQGAPIGPAMAAIRRQLDGWLGEPSWKQSAGRVTLIYRVNSERPPITPIRLKVEVNTREHFAALGFRHYSYNVDSRWFNGSAKILSYAPEELLGTKLRALYQRRKGRDLFDLALALGRLPGLDSEKIIECFRKYLDHDGLHVSRAEFEANMASKLKDKVFLGDLAPLLSAEIASSDAPYDPRTAYTSVHAKLIVRLPGEPWKGTK